MESREFERAVVATLVELIESAGLKHDPTAKLAWPNKKAAGRTWQAIRSPQTEQRLTIEDAHAMASLLNISMSQLCALAESKEIQARLGQLPKKTKDMISPKRYERQDRHSSAWEDEALDTARIQN